VPELGGFGSMRLRGRKVLNAVGGLYGMRLVAYVRVSREDERLENQEYAVYRWATERWHQIEDVVRDVGVSGALLPGERPG
jgi:predicted site-specific integrase-resolvase